MVHYIYLGVPNYIIQIVFLSLFVSANNADPDEMPHNVAFYLGLHCYHVAFHQGLHCLLNYTFLGHYHTKNSVISGLFPVFLGCTSTKQWIKCLVQEHNTVTLPVAGLEHLNK